MQLKFNGNADKHVIIRRIRTWMLVFWVVFTMFCLMESFSTKAHAQSNETIFLNNASDPPTPSARYVLDKLNKHLSNSIADEDTSQVKYIDLWNKVDSLQKQDLDKKLAVLTEKQETNSWILKAVLGGMATILGKEILEMIKKRP